ncbi:MAG: hypothetical protein ACHQHN_00255 [Sphingobacteriales bacterium]
MYPYKHFILVSCILFCSGFGANQQKSSPIILRDEKLNFSPHEYHIANIIDERADKNTVALLVYKTEAGSYLTRPSDFKGGAALSIKQFIDHNLGQDKSLRPVVISIKSLKLEETSSAGRKVNGHLSIDLSFDLQKDYGILHLTDYKGGTRYTRSDGQTDIAEHVLRQGIESALSWFNNWINMNAESDPRLAKAVKVKLSDYTEKPEGDTIYYAANRPLNWDDFRDKHGEGSFEAEVFASVGYIERATVESGIINLNIALKVDMPKSDCWVRDRSRDGYVLNHEQRHFDITKIVGEHFKQKIAAMKLPPDNYDGEINVEYLETLRELHRMQTQYDSETHHGANHGMQEEWNEKIDKELKSLGIKK